MNYAIVIGQHYILCMIAVGLVLNYLRFRKVFRYWFWRWSGNLLLWLAAGLIVRLFFPQTGWWPPLVAVVVCIGFMMFSDYQFTLRRRTARIEAQRRRERESIAAKRHQS